MRVLARESENWGIRASDFSLKEYRGYLGCKVWALTLLKARVSTAGMVASSVEGCRVGKTGSG